MVSTTTQDKIQQLQNCVRGEWIKYSYYYQTNAFDSGYSGNGYALTVEKNDNGRWIFYAEEHEPSDLIASGDHAPNGYKTMKEAKEAAEVFGESYQQTVEEYEAELAQKEETVTNHLENKAMTTTKNTSLPMQIILEDSLTEDGCYQYLKTLSLCQDEDEVLAIVVTQDGPNSYQDKTYFSDIQEALLWARQRYCLSNI